MSPTGPLGAWGGPQPRSSEVEVLTGPVTTHCFSVLSQNPGFQNVLEKLQHLCPTQHLPALAQFHG